MVILPKRNEADLEDIPAEVRQAIQFVFVDTVDEVLAAGLEKASRSPRRKQKLVQPVLVEDHAS
jgi:ATP-dependent Lon protease